MLGFIASGGVGALAYLLPVITTSLTAVGAPIEVSGGPAASPAPPSGAPFTVLLLGSDNDSKSPKEQVLTQSMILIRVVPSSKQVTMLSIPRDLWVPLSAGGSGKIDTAYSYGGSRAAIATVERNFQVKIDDYAWIGLRGLVNLINRLGGVDLVPTNPVLDDFYPNDLGAGDPYGYSRVAVLPGPQHMDGAHALEYVRSRHGDQRADFGRSIRQQQLLLALRGKAKNVKPADLPDLAKALGGEINTSLSLERMRALITLAGQLGTENVRQVLLLPPLTRDARSSDGQDILLPDWGGILPLVRQSFS
jgi:LCP family protein required for cell wall assembly